MAWFSRIRRQRVSPPSWGGPVGPATIQPLVDAFTGWLDQGPFQKLGVVQRCLQLTAQQVASMPLRMHGTAATPVWLGNPDPDVYTSLTEAIFAATWSRYASGNIYLFVTSRYADGYPATWIVLAPEWMTVGYGADDEPTYTWYGYPIDRSDLLHVKRNPVAGQLVGTPALDGYWSNIQSAAASEMAAASALTDGGVPRVALKYKRKLLGTQAKDLQAQWIAAVQNRGGAPPVLDDDLDLKELSWSPRDAMLLELREYDSKAIASAFGVPAFLLNLPQAGGLNYSNPEMLFQTWWTVELMPASHQLETALSSWLPRGSWVAFDPQAILRPDPAQLATMWTGLLNVGAVTVDELRATVLGLPPLEEAADTLPSPSGAPTQIIEPPVAVAPSLPATQGVLP
jgi:HK97 family phage portal protein